MATLLLLQFLPGASIAVSGHSIPPQLSLVLTEPATSLQTFLPELATPLQTFLQETLPCPSVEPGGNTDIICLWVGAGGRGRHGEERGICGGREEC